MKRLRILKTYEAFLGGEKPLPQAQPQTQAQVQTQSQPQQAQPQAQAQPQTQLKNFQFNSDNIIYFYVPVKVATVFDDSVFGYYSDIESIVRQLSDNGIEADWLIDQFHNWKRFKLEDPGEEPTRDDYEEGENGDADFDYDWYDWNERNDEYERIENSDDSNLIDDYVKDEFGSWDNFKNEFEIDVLIQYSNIDRWDKHEIYDEIKTDFNDSDLVQYFDDADELGVVDMKVIDDDFNNDGRFTIEVKTTKDLNEDEIDIIRLYIEGQCSDGWICDFCKTTYRISWCF